MNYVYAGSTGINLGRFGTVTQGQILDLTDDEISKLGGNANFFPLPLAGVHPITGAAKPKLFKSGAYTLVSVTDSGKLIVLDHGAAINITLPAAPVAGDNYELEFTDDAFAAGFTATIVRNGKLIDGVASDFALTAALTRKAVYYNGVGWISF